MKSCDEWRHASVRFLIRNDVSIFIANFVYFDNQNVPKYVFFYITDKIDLQILYLAIISILNTEYYWKILLLL